jgi:mRNA-degrading endonuclease toxin of MazEF toxin-antitoxin module
VTGRPIRQGDIFWLDDCPSLHGDVAKRRPVVVVSPTALVETRPDVLIVACTSSILPSNTTAIELPSRERMPQTKTGLNRRTWAVPQWLLPVPGELLVQHIGRLGGSTMRRLLQAVAELHGK